jgi:hypothetical protein
MILKTKDTSGNPDKKSNSLKMARKMEHLSMLPKYREQEHCQINKKQKLFLLLIPFVIQIG